VTFWYDDQPRAPNRHFRRLLGAETELTKQTKELTAMTTFSDQSRGQDSLRSTFEPPKRPFLMPYSCEVVLGGQSRANQ